MPTKKLCVHLAQEKQAFYCLLKHAVIPRSNAERVCFSGPLTEACIKEYTVKQAERLRVEKSTVQQPTLERTKATEEKVTIDKLITVENMKVEAPKTEDASLTLEEPSDIDFNEELLMKVPLGKNQLKKVTETPTKTTELTKLIDYSVKAKDYEEMARKMHESGLYSEAAIDICGASLALILAGDIKQAIQSLKTFVYILKDPIKEQVISHPAFLLARALISAVYHKDKGEFDEAKGKFYEAEFHTRSLYSKLQYGEDRAFIAEAMKKIEW
jgi:hypothetical protein